MHTQFRLLSTVLSLAPRRLRPSQRGPARGFRLDAAASGTSARTVNREVEHVEDNEYKLPRKTSLVIILFASALLQVSLYIVVSSSNQYTAYLGGTATFSGLVIGIPPAFSGLGLLPLMKLDQGGYKRPLHFALASGVLGNVLYSLAYCTKSLYLILIGRIVSGFSFTFFLYSKRYCSDPRIVGVRRRTTLAGWIVLGQGVGFTVGPFLGGLFYKVGFSNPVFNGYTSPTWVLAGILAVFWVFATLLFEDVPHPASISPAVELTPVSSPCESGSPGEDTPVSKIDSVTMEMPMPPEPESFRMSSPQLGVTITMCWFAMTCFFILGAWEANIPVFTSSDSPFFPYHFSPFAAGNLIALGGVCTFPFLFLNVFLARRVQDRHTLALGTSLGTTGLVLALIFLRTRTMSYGTLFTCWFLIALGFNLTSTVTLSLLSKQLPGEWNARISLAIQYSNYVGRVCGAVWGGAGVKVGMLNYVGMQFGIVGAGAVMFLTLWRQLKAKTG
ncbi:MFS general substrate transporter [Obba rivulosa]|uniref:MFS general substrate transporter n=1 Tax=Obba rivulosa TaxID=1052685 RepID=A0A8E2B0H5_9APHY|nr:MFS general substrate transporter [Obba rivulosa]